MLGWFYYGGGEELYNELSTDPEAQPRRLPLPARCRPSRSAGSRSRSTSADDFKGLKYRTVGLSADLFKEMGAAVTILAGGEIVPALDRGLLDAAEFNNPSSDLLLGFPDVVKDFMLQSHHQAGECFEVIFNKAKFDALPAELKAILNTPRRRPRPTCSGRRSTAIRRICEAIKERGVKVHKTPDAVLEAQLEAWDKVIDEVQQGPVLQEGARIAEGLGEARRRTSFEQPDTTVARDGLRPLLQAEPARQPRRPRMTLTRRRCSAIEATVSCARRCDLSEAAAEAPAMRFVCFVDRFSTCVGKTFAWCILILTFTISYEVFSRYVLLAPTDWAFDASYMLYGTLFMMAGAYALSRNAHVRGDFLYRAWPPRTQAGLDLVLYFLFFFPGMLAFVYAGYGFRRARRG